MESVCGTVKKKKPQRKWEKSLNLFFFFSLKIRAVCTAFTCMKKDTG